MHQFCLQALFSGNYTTLKEIMLKFSYFQEISQDLTDSQFRCIISKLQPQTINKNQPLYLYSSNLYFFFEKGGIYRKEMMGKSEKSIRIRQKNRQLTNNTKIIVKLPQIKESIAFQIDQFDTYQEKSYSINKNVYYSSTSKPTIAIRLPLNELSQEYQQLLKNISSQKVKFLAQLGSFLNLEKHIITENIHKFQYLMLSFGQYLYHKKLRNQHLFFLKNGVVEIQNSNKAKSKYIVNAKSIIGVQSSDQEAAKSMSHKLECYVVKKGLLKRHFSKYTNRNPTNHLFIQSAHNLISICEKSFSKPYDEQFQKQKSQNKKIQNSGDERFIVCNVQCLSRGRTGFSSIGSFKQSGQQRDRLLRLKQYFSNFYNEVFEKYSQRKMRHIGFNQDNKQNLILYNIRVLKRKAPNMDQLKKKLSKIRIQKMQACKNTLKVDGNERQLIFTKIRAKNLQQ